MLAICIRSISIDMKKPNFVHDSLLCLTYGLKNSDIEFSIPEEGFKKLAQLFHGIAQAIEDAGDKVRVRRGRQFSTVF